HGNDVIEADVDRTAIAGVEFHELGAVRGENVGDRARLALRHSFEIELQLDALPVHRRLFELIVVIAGNRLIALLIGHDGLRLQNLCPKRTQDSGLRSQDLVTPTRAICIACSSMLILRLSPESSVLSPESW